jgi:hypothetical protein
MRGVSVAGKHGGGDRASQCLTIMKLYPMPAAIKITASTFIPALPT